MTTEQMTCEFKGKTYDKIGCKHCNMDFWKIFYNEEEGCVARCVCGHIIKIHQTNITKRAEVVAIPLRFFV